MCVTCSLFHYTNNVSTKRLYYSTFRKHFRRLLLSLNTSLIANRSEKWVRYVFVCSNGVKQDGSLSLICRMFPLVATWVVSVTCITNVIYKKCLSICHNAPKLVLNWANDFNMGPLLITSVWPDYRIGLEIIPHEICISFRCAFRVVLCFSTNSCNQTLSQGCFTNTGAIIRLPQCPWSNHEIFVCIYFTRTVLTHDSMK